MEIADRWVRGWHVNKIHGLLESFFKNEGKIESFLITKNPLLGNKSPMEMINQGREAKLLKFIETSLEDNKL